MLDNRTNADRAGERGQSFFWDETEQSGNTYVPGKETKQSRAKRASRVKKAIRSCDEQFHNTSSASSNGTTSPAEHDYSYDSMAADLKDVLSTESR